MRREDRQASRVVDVAFVVWLLIFGGAAYWFGRLSGWWITD